MKRLHGAVLGALAIAGLLVVPTAFGAHTPPISRAYFADTEPAQLKYLGTASSAIRIFASGRITVFTRFEDVSPGTVWNVQIYDRGTCASPRSFVATLGGVTISGGGEGSRTSALTSRQATLLRNAVAAGRSIVLRVAQGSRLACERFDAVHPDSLEPGPRVIPEPSFEPTAPVVTQNPFPTAPGGGAPTASPSASTP